MAKLRGTTRRGLDRIWAMPWLRGHIGRRMAVLIIAFSSFVTLVISVVQLGLEYRELRGAVERQLDDIAVYVDNIAGSVWAFDERQIKSALDGIEHLPNIEVASIEMNGGPATWSVGLHEAKSVIARRYVLEGPQRNEEIGSLTVTASLDAVNETIFAHAISILLSNLFKTLCVALFMLFMFQHMVTGRLAAIKAKVRRLGPELFPTESPLTHQTVVVPPELDELDAVDWALDRTVEELKRTAEQRLAAEKRIVDLNVQLQSLLNAATDFSIISADTEGNVRVFSRGAERMLGYRADEVIGKSPAMFHRDSEVKMRARELSKQLGRPIAGFETFVALAREGGSDTRNWTYVRQDGVGVRVSLTINAIRTGDDELIGYVGIARDLTQQLEAEAQLLKLTLNLENRVRERTEELQTSTNLLQKTLDDLHKTQGQLVQSEKLASLGSLVAAVAHELNTPIGNCLTAASAIHDKTVDFERDIAAGSLRKSQLDSYLAASRNASDLLTRGLERCAALVSNFKQVAANAQGMASRQFYLAPMLEAQCGVLRSALCDRKFVIELDCAQDLQLTSYPEAIEQIIAHVVSNAIIHGFAGRNAGTVRIAVVDDGESLRLTIADDGRGMSDDDRRHAFDPFFTTQLGKGGSGLGLYICYNLATGPLGGTLSAVSAPGQGSTFTLTLPKRAPGAGTR